MVLCWKTSRHIPSVLIVRFVEKYNIRLVEIVNIFMHPCTHAPFTLVKLFYETEKKKHLTIFRALSFTCFGWKICWCKAQILSWIFFRENLSICIWHVLKTWAKIKQTVFSRKKIMCWWNGEIFSSFIMWNEQHLSKFTFPNEWVVITKNAEATAPPLYYNIFTIGNNTATATATAISMAMMLWIRYDGFCRYHVFYVNIVRISIVFHLMHTKCMSFER